MLGNGNCGWCIFLDAFGNFYVYESNGDVSNLFVARNVANANPIVFEQQNQTSIGGVSRFDGASCAFAPHRGEKLSILNQ
jgi:hypothetical protein